MKINLGNSTDLDLREIHAFLHAARIAAVSSDPRGNIKDSARSHIIKITDAVEAEMERRGMTQSPLRLGERIYGQGCALLDEMVPA